MFMIFNYNNHEQSSGIYLIQNTITNKIYIGKTKHFKQRWNQHKSNLLNHSHTNKFLQNEFDTLYIKLNHTNFLIFSILEVHPTYNKQIIKEREDYYLSHYFDNQHYCYNKIPQPKTTISPFEELLSLNS